MASTAGLVNKAGTALTEIVESIERVTQIVSEIATASAEQSTGIEEVNKVLAQMDEMTQQNSAPVEENAATAKTLEQQAFAMDERVAFFRIAEGAAMAAAPAVAAQSRAAVPVREPPSRRTADRSTACMRTSPPRSRAIRIGRNSRTFP